MPPDRTFPDLISFVIYGTFVGPTDRLCLFEISNDDLGLVSSRATNRKTELAENEWDRVNDTFNEMWITTDQRIRIEALRIQKWSQVQNSNKSNLAALVAPETAVGRKIDATENRTLVCCKEYNAETVFRKRVDELIEDQISITNDIKNFTKNMKPIVVKDNVFSASSSTHNPSATRMKFYNMLPFFSFIFISFIFT